METDLDLIEAARSMNAEALACIFDRYAAALYNYAFRLCENYLMADYIVGDVFSKLLEHLSAGKGPNANLRSYLFEMTYHVYVDEVRASCRSTTIEAVALTMTDGFSTQVSAENQMLYEKILQAIRLDLTEDQRHIIILRLMEGFSLKETAAITGKTVTNVKVIQNRAIAALRRALDTNTIEMSSLAFAA